ncbi:SWIM zinc finger family protein [Halosimplex aquaticum]|uniref:SWIM zinc finger family protein n=1 Tax=Halosimplex aquaticum TaxID=3026162 RepID=A0ABD5Y3N0_9EURY|nr:SWIM zinc finger family protein [Halosimplex aquaticum]
MSIESGSNWQPSDDLPDRLGGPPTLSMPDDWTKSTPWRRAQEEADEGGPITDAERMVYLSGSDHPHRVTFALKGRTLLADCDCKAHRFNDGWCSHVASLWWQWTRGRIDVSHLDTGREYPEPPAWLRLDDDPTAYDHLTPAELDAYLTCDLGEMGNREYADLSDRSAGTIGNLLRRARDSLGGVDR